MSYKNFCLSEIADIFSGYAFKSQELSDSGIPVIKIGNIQNKRVTKKTESFFPEELLKEKLKRYFLQPNDFLIAMTGAGSVGKIGKMWNHGKDNFLVNQRVGIVRPQIDKCDSKFIYYVLSLDYYEKQLYALGLGAGQPNISSQEIGSLEIPLPSLPTQRKIAGILSAYDDLIENNTRRIEILEQMARMLYREWFVTFRFPVGDGEDGGDRGSDRPSSSHPVELVESELGLIPKGWEVKAIKDLPIKIIDGDRSKNYPKSYEFIDEGVLFLSTKNISDFKIDLSNNNFISEEKFLSIKKGRVIPLDIVMTTRGSIGKVALFNCSFTKALINAQMLILRSESENLNQLYLFYLMSDLGFQNLLRSFASGSAQPQIPIQDLKQINILYPAPEIQNKFSSIVRSNVEQIKNLQEKNINLRKTRDLLLPRLISGEIDVEELDINLGAMND